jgi:hypothetical protein
MVEALCYKPEGRGFYFPIQLTQSFHQHYGLRFDSVSNRNEYPGIFLGLKGQQARNADNLNVICVPIV